MAHSEIPTWLIPRTVKPGGIIRGLQIGQRQSQSPLIRSPMIGTRVAIIGERMTGSNFNWIIERANGRGTRHMAGFLKITILCF